MLVAAAGAPMGGRQAEAEVGGAGVGALGLPGRRQVAAAAVGRAEERAPDCNRQGSGWGTVPAADAPPQLARFRSGR
jgi:hypothetical protein